MKRHFITYADRPFQAAGERIVREAEATGQFDSVRRYGPADVSAELAARPVFREARGGGYWSWKPDVIAQELERMDDGDLLLYADAGCLLKRGPEWTKYWRRMESHDLFVQKIFQRVCWWTRQSLLRHFAATLGHRLRAPQFMATVIFLKKTPFTVRLVADWRELMREHPELYRDVTDEERKSESPDFRESRHDQSVFTALVYRALDDAADAPRIAAAWDHVEYLSPVGSQVIQAMRWNSTAPFPIAKRLIAVGMRLLRNILIRPQFLI